MASELVKITGPELVESPLDQGGLRTIEVRSPFDMEPAAFSKALERRGENMRQLLKWLASDLTEGVHFGKIHVVSKDKCPAQANCKIASHFSKPVLFKPGAEKINQRLGLAARYRPLTHEERTNLGAPDGHIIVKCELVSANGLVVSEGMGSRALAKDYGDVNKAIKMAEKSGRINASIQLGLSDCYTQDLEDTQDLSPALQASIDQVKASKAAKGTKVAPEPPKEDPGPSTEAEGLPEKCYCGGQIRVYFSTQKEHLNRAYLQCESAHDRIEEAIIDGATPREAAVANSRCYRAWAPKG